MRLPLATHLNDPIKLVHGAVAWEDGLAQQELPQDAPCAHAASGLQGYTPTTPTPTHPHPHTILTQDAPSVHAAARRARLVLQTTCIRPDDLTLGARAQAYLPLLPTAFHCCCCCCCCCSLNKCRCNGCSSTKRPLGQSTSPTYQSRPQRSAPTAGPHVHAIRVLGAAQQDLRRAIPPRGHVVCEDGVVALGRVELRN